MCPKPHNKKEEKAKTNNKTQNRQNTTYNQSKIQRGINCFPIFFTEKERSVITYSCHFKPV